MDTDTALIERIKEGEKELYAQLMQRYNQRLFRVAKSIIRDDAEIEDVMQETYLKAFLHLDQFEGRSQFSTWLIRILINQANSALSKQKRQEHEDENKLSNLASSGNPEQMLIQHELGKYLENAIKALPEQYRTVYIMREVEGISGRETADCLDISEENVRVRLFRAKNILKESLFRKSKGEIDLFRFGGERCGKMTAAVMYQLERLN